MPTHFATKYFILLKYIIHTTHAETVKNNYTYYDYEVSQVFVLKSNFQMKQIDSDYR